MKKWLKEIKQVLENPKYTQIIGTLEKYQDGDVIGKCALGELNCALGPRKTNGTSYSDILKRYRVPTYFIDDLLPYLDRHRLIFIFNSQYEDGLQDYIWKLNDEGFTYDQIVEFLEVTFG